MDNLITKNDFYTLMDIVIVDSIHIDMVQWTLTTTTHATTIVVQEKTWSYTERIPNDDFIPFVIKTNGCLHSRFASFLIICAQTTITRHHVSSLIPSMFISHYQQCVSIALQCAQAITILQWTSTFGRSSSFLPHIIGNAPSSLTNLW